jgi:uncharacterized membrane protein YjgN (DUF898 family)
MDELTTKKHKLNFIGEGSAYFGVVIINWLLIVLTLGIYYPWAKAKQLQYLYGATTLDDDTFTFSGTGKEMFRGVLKAGIIILILNGFLYIGGLVGFPVIGGLLYGLGFLALIPIAIHGAYKYRLSRTSWRGIRMGYRGNLQDFAIQFWKWILFTFLSLGLYMSWFTINMRKYIINNIRFGDAQFEYDAEGDDYFMINLKGFLLTLLTFGIYSFWWNRDKFDFFVDNLALKKDKQKIQFNSIATVEGILGLTIINNLLIIFTLGLAYPYVVVRTMNFVMQNIELVGNINFDDLLQTEQNYKDATGEDIGDFLNIDLAL